MSILRRKDRSPKPRSALFSLRVCRIDSTTTSTESHNAMHGEVRRKARQRARHHPGRKCKSVKCAQLRVIQQPRALNARAAHYKSCSSSAAQRQRANKNERGRAEQRARPVSLLKSSQGAVVACLSLCGALRRKQNQKRSLRRKQLDEQRTITSK